MSACRARPMHAHPLIPYLPVRDVRRQRPAEEEREAGRRTNFDRLGLRPRRRGLCKDAASPDAERCRTTFPGRAGAYPRHTRALSRRPAVQLRARKPRRRGRRDRAMPSLVAHGAATTGTAHADSDGTNVDARTTTTTRHGETMFRTEKNEERKMRLRSGGWRRRADGGPFRRRAAFQLRGRLATGCNDTGAAFLATVPRRPVTGVGWSLLSTSGNCTLRSG